MQVLSEKKYLAIFFLVVVIGVVVFLIGFHDKTAPPQIAIIPTTPTTTEIIPTKTYRIFGASVKGRALEEYTFGTGKTRLLFVGGMHGGYEWNSVVLAYQFIDYLEDPKNFPDGFTISVIPALNPDGVFEVTGKEGRFTPADVPDVSKKPSGYGRLNANKVDLNRNLDCNWKPKSMWRGTEVSAGKSAFSEPETSALRAVVASSTPAAVIFWHSQSGSVYASACNNGILPDTLSIMNAYAKAAGYTPVKAFDAYKITGDSEGWLASIGIPAITVELKTHETVEWEQNLAGITALFDFYGKKKN